jgi:hypothetical protein
MRSARTGWLWLKANDTVGIRLIDPETATSSATSRERTTYLNNAAASAITNLSISCRPKPCA